jgi:hypothetical protein
MNPTGGSAASRSARGRSTSLGHQRSDVGAASTAVVSHQAGDDRADRRRGCGRARCHARVAWWSRDRPRAVDVGGTAGINKSRAGARLRGAQSDQRSPAAPAASADLGLGTGGQPAGPMDSSRPSNPQAGRRSDANTRDAAADERGTNAVAITLGDYRDWTQALEPVLSGCPTALALFVIETLDRN